MVMQPAEFGHLDHCRPQIFELRASVQTSRRRFKRSTALLQPNIRDASHQGPISQGRAHPPPSDGGSPASRRLHVSAGDLAPQAPTHCADAHDCNESSTLAESSGDVPQTSGLSNRDTLFVSSRSRVRRSSSLSDSQLVIAILRHPRLGSNRQDAWRRSDPDRGSELVATVGVSDHLSQLL